jgi:hypothetical protein
MRWEKKGYNCMFCIGIVILDLGLVNKPCRWTWWLSSGVYGIARYDKRIV